MTVTGPATSSDPSTSDPSSTDEVVDELRTFLEENWDPELTVREWWQRLAGTKRHRAPANGTIPALSAPTRAA